MFLKNLPTSKIKKILIIKFGHIGDVLLFTPALRAIRKTFPRAEISMLVGSWAKEVVENNLNIDRLFVYDAFWLGYNDRQPDFKKLVELIRIIRKLRKEKFDLGVEVRGIFKNVLFMYLCNIKYRVSYNNHLTKLIVTKTVPFTGFKNEIDRYLDIIRAVNATTGNKHPEIFLSPQDKKFAGKFFRSNRIKKGDLVITIYPGAPWVPRRWPKERFAELADKLINLHHAKIIIIGGKDETLLSKDISRLMKSEPIIATGKTSLRQSAAIIKQSDLFIGNDAGPMHLAAAVKTPVIALFGPGHPIKFAPYGRKSMMIRKQIDCNPCPQDPDCLKGLSCCRALELITVSDVLSAVREQIKTIRKNEDEKYEV